MLSVGSSILVRRLVDHHLIDDLLEPPDEVADNLVFLVNEPTAMKQRISISSSQSQLNYVFATSDLW